MGRSGSQQDFLGPSLATLAHARTGGGMCPAVPGLTRPSCLLRPHLRRKEGHSTTEGKEPLVPAAPVGEKEDIKVSLGLRGASVLGLAIQSPAPGWAHADWCHGEVALSPHTLLSVALSCVWP